MFCHKERSLIADPRCVCFIGDGDPKSTRQCSQMFLDQMDDYEEDFYSNGGVIAQLEARCAEILGKEAALWVPTGTLANHLALRRHCAQTHAHKAIVSEQSHIYRDSGDCVQRLSNIALVPLAPGQPNFSREQLVHEIGGQTSNRVHTPIGAVSIESPVRRAEGQFMSWEEMQDITQYCKSEGIRTHLDGARLWMMSEATGILVSDYASLFDSVYVSLWKYFDAPFGAILAGSTDFIRNLHHERRMFGASLPCSAFPASLVLQGLDAFPPQFHQAMTQGKELIGMLKQIPELTVIQHQNASNIFPIILDPSIDETKFREYLHEQYIFFLKPHGRKLILTINVTLLRQSNQTIVDAIKTAIQKGAPQRNDSVE
jgi:threonine aldolase